MQNNKINFFSEIIKEFDYFGVYYTFHYNQKERYKSIVGGLFFIIYLLFGLFFILLNIEGFIKRKNINLIYYDRKLSNPFFLNFHNYSNNFAFGLNCDNENGTKSLNNYLNLKISFVSQFRDKGNITRNKSNLNLHKCSELDFDENFLEFFRENQLYNFYCLDDISKSISGFYTDTYFNYYEFTVSIRDNSSEIYYNMTEILLNYECKFEIFYGDTTINVYDYKNPVKTYLNQRYIILLPDSYLKYNYFFKKVSFKTFDNLFLETSNFKNYMSFSRTEEYKQLKTLNRYEKSYINYNMLAKIFLRSDNIDTIVQRKYEKFTQFMAQLSTVLSVSFIIIYIFVSKINFYFSNFVIMKSLFNYNLKKEERLLLRPFKKKNSNYNVILQTIINESNNNILSINQGNKLEKFSKFKNLQNIIQKDDTKIEKIISKKKNNYKDGYKYFQLNIFEILINTIFCCSPYKALKYKNNIYKKSFKKISNYVDITNYVQNIRKLEIFFYLVLDKNKKILINYLQNPIIKINNDYDFCEKITNKYNLNINNYNNILNSFKQFFKQVNQNIKINSLDKKMLKFISNQIEL